MRAHPVACRRPDFLKQMYRWAVQYATPDREENPNRAAMRVEVIDASPTVSIGFSMAFLKYTDAGCVCTRVSPHSQQQTCACACARARAVPASCGVGTPVSSHRCPTHRAPPHPPHTRALRRRRSRSPVPAIEFECLMDEEVVSGFDMVGMDKDGFPVLQTMDGEEKTVKGKYFLVRRNKATPVPTDFVEPTKAMLTDMMEAVNKYYSFGSPFSEEF